jgi:Ca-activated chloride channel family protein
VRLEWPIALLALALVPAATVAYVLVERRRARFALRFPNVDVLTSIAPPPAPAWRRFLPPALFLLAVAVALLAVARPQVARSVQREQATIVLVVDTSGSMIANDVQPTRLGAAQKAVRRFVRKLPGRFRVGVVTFSTAPRVSIPITDNHELAIRGFDHLTAFGGTALGDAIARAIELIRRSGAAEPDASPSASSVQAVRFPPSAIVLLSDGAQNRGQLPAMEGAALAKKLKIPIYTVALGTAGGTIRIGEGGLTQSLSVPPDPATLKQIALETGGAFYNAASSARLNAVYEGLASRLSARRSYREATSYLLGGASLLLVAAGVLSAFWLPRLP